MQISNAGGYQNHWYPSNPMVNGYAKPVPGGSQYLRLYTTPDPSGTFNWFFAHRENAKGAIHCIPVLKDAKGREFIHVIVQKSPVMGGRPIVQLPAGLWGDLDPSESATRAVAREMKEETGYTVTGSRIIANQFFATSPGMTTESKGFALASVTGEPSDKFRDPGEKASIIASFDVPVSTFTNYDKFIGWISDMKDRGYTVGMDILAARALLPPTRPGRRLDVIS